jgi:hypothetical protein
MTSGLPRIAWHSGNGMLRDECLDHPERSDRKMRVCLYLDPSRFLRWHHWLAAALSSTPGCHVSLVFAATAHPLPWSCMLALELERTIYGLHTDHAIDQIDVSKPRPRATGPVDCSDFDVVVDLAGQGDQLPACRRVLTPLFNSVPGEVGAIAALLGDEPLRIEVHDSASFATTANACPAMADSQVFVRALDGVLSRAAELILKVLDGPSCAVPIKGIHPPLKAGTPNIPALPAAVMRVAHVLTRKIISLIGQIATGGNTWAVAYRFDHSIPLLDKRQARFFLLCDDMRRYYADPFPFRRDGQYFVFVEEFPFETQRGCISVAVIDRTGSVIRPRIIIEEPYHLSFPFVFEHDGQIWMIPETADAKRIDLYRAELFPYRWKREGSLLEGVAAYDATVLRHHEQFWLLASLGRWKSTSWDNLSIFHARSLTGPWTPHSRNPVLLDAMRCRAAGAPFRRKGDILRPVQDCSRIYGGAITFNRVDALNEAGFRQTVIGRIECGTPGCHTYNRRAGLEVLDIFGATRGLAHVTASYTPITVRKEIRAPL